MSIILALKAKFFPKEKAVVKPTEPQEEQKCCPCNDVFKNAMEAAQRNRKIHEQELNQVADQVIHDICKMITTRGEFVGVYYMRVGMIFSTVQIMKMTGGILQWSNFSLNKTRIQYVREIVQDYFESEGFVTEYKEDEEGKFKYVRISLPDIEEGV